MIIKIVLSALIAAGIACAQVFPGTGGAAVVPVHVAALPASATVGTVAAVDDGSGANPCTLGGGTIHATCIWTGANWQTYGSDASASGGGDLSSNTSTSVNSEIMLFSGTGGKTAKRATGSGVAKITSGVLGTAAYTDITGLWTTCTGFMYSDGTCVAKGTSANNMVQLNASSQLPAVSAALLTNFPVLNQNTSGTAAAIAGGSGGQVAFQSSAGVTAFSSGIAYNDTTKFLGLIGGVTVGQTGVLTGQISFNGTTSGTAVLKPADAAGTPTITLPGSTGTLMLTTDNAATATLATSSTNVAGGGTGQVPFQSAAGATAFSSGFAYNDTTKIAGLIGGVSVGQTGTLTGKLVYSGVTSGTVTVQPEDAAGTAIVVKLPAVTGKLPSLTGSLSGSKCLHTVGVLGEIAEAAADCGSGGGGSGTVNSGTATHVGFYATSAAAISDAGADLTFDGTHTWTLGASGLLNLSAAAATAFKVPVAAGAAPTADGQIAVNSTTHEVAIGSNGATKTLLSLDGSGNATMTGTLTAGGLTIPWTGSVTTFPFFGSVNGVDHVDLVANSDATQILYKGVELNAGDLSGQIVMSGWISPTALSATTSDWAPTGLATASGINITTSGGSRNLTGIVAQPGGTELSLCNSNAAGGDNVTFVHDSTSTAANRFYIDSASNYALRPLQCIKGQYNAAATRWVLFGKAFTNLTGTDVTGNLPLTKLASQAADTIIMNATGAGAIPTAVALPTTGTNGCAGGADAIGYNTSTHAFVCNTISVSGSLSGQVAFTGIITPTTLAANANNWAPTGLATASIIRAATDNSGAKNITGIASQPDGTMIQFQNVGSTDAINLINNSASSSAGNKFCFDSATNIVVRAGATTWLIKDGTADCWRATKGVTNLATDAVGTLALSLLATQAADTVLVNATGGTAAPTAVAFPTTGTNGCAGGANAIGYNTTTHAFVCNSITSVSGLAGTATALAANGGNCSAGQLAAGVDASGVAEGCSQVTSSYTNNTIAQTGVDINTSNQVTVTHLAAALPQAQGGTGTTGTSSQGQVLCGGASVGVWCTGPQTISISNTLHAITWGASASTTVYCSDCAIPIVKATYFASGKIFSTKFNGTFNTPATIPTSITTYIYLCDATDCSGTAYLLNQFIMAPFATSTNEYEWELNNTWSFLDATHVYANGSCTMNTSSTAAAYKAHTLPSAGTAVTLTAATWYIVPGFKPSSESTVTDTINIMHAWLKSEN